MVLKRIHTGTIPILELKTLVVIFDKCVNIILSMKKTTKKTKIKPNLESVKLQGPVALPI